MLSWTPGFPTLRLSRSPNLGHRTKRPDELDRWILSTWHPCHGSLRLVTDLSGEEEGWRFRTTPIWQLARLCMEFENGLGGWKFLPGDPELTASELRQRKACLHLWIVLRTGFGGNNVWRSWTGWQWGILKHDTSHADGPPSSNMVQGFNPCFESDLTGRKVPYFCTRVVFHVCSLACKGNDN